MQITWHADAPVFDDHQRRLADEIWAKKPDHVFNAALLVHQATTVRANHIDLTGAFTEYRFYYAQKRSGQSFGLTPIGVSGLIICEDYVIFARRSSHVTSYPGKLELVPSGGLDREVAREDGTIDYLAKLRSEFAEETGQSAAIITAIEPFALIHDPADPVIDIACRLHLNIGRAPLQASLAQSDEYDDPAAVPLAALDDWLTAHQDEVIPTSRAILAAFRLEP